MRTNRFVLHLIFGVSLGIVATTGVVGAATDERVLVEVTGVMDAETGQPIHNATTHVASSMMLGGTGVGPSVAVGAVVGIGGAIVQGFKDADRSTKGRLLTVYMIDAPGPKAAFRRLGDPCAVAPMELPADHVASDIEPGDWAYLEPAEDGEWQVVSIKDRDAAMKAITAHRCFKGTAFRSAGGKDLRESSNSPTQAAASATTPLATGKP